uniref:Odorant receptor n=1 Tax=Locusta migratoria TaxID=7004 RepID=A0A0M4JMF1_LOCMI|nr:odorant receptor 45 [Locusta migratoria]
MAATERRQGEVGEDEVLRSNVRLLQLAGAWPPTAPRGLGRLFPLHLASVYLSQLANIAMALRLMQTARGDMHEITQALMNAMTLVGGILKLLHLSTHVPAYRRLVLALRDVIRIQRHQCERDPHVASLLARAHRKALRLTFWPIAYLNMLALGWYSIPVVFWALGWEKRLLPFFTLHGVDSYDFVLYAAIYFVQCHAIFYWCFISIGQDMFFVTCMVHVAAQLQILNARLSNLGGGQGASNELGRLYSCRAEEDGPCERKPISDTMYTELRNCIKTHQEILKFVQLLQQVMSPVAMAQFLCSVGAACVTLYQATFNPEGNSSLKCLMYLPIPAFQIFVYCWGGHELMENEENIGSVRACRSSASQWLFAGRRVTSSLRTLMCRAQRPLLLHAGKLYPVSRDTFLSLINASFSFYTVLRHMNNR